MKITFCYNVQFDVEIESEKLREIVNDSEGLDRGDLLAACALIHEPRLRDLECDGVELVGVYNDDEVIYK